LKIRDFIKRIYSKNFIIKTRFGPINTSFIIQPIIILIILFLYPFFLYLKHCLFILLISLITFSILLLILFSISIKPLSFFITILLILFLKTPFLIHFSFAVFLILFLSPPLFLSLSNPLLIFPAFSTFPLSFFPSIHEVLSHKTNAFPPISINSP
jgi:hypothetical protein